MFDLLCDLNSSAHVKDERLNKLKMRARRFELMEKFYSRWKEKVQNRAEEKIEETGKEVKWPLSTFSSEYKRHEFFLKFLKFDLIVHGNILTL